MIQSCTEQGEELKNSDILVVTMECSIKKNVENVRIAIRKAPETSRIDNYPALFLLFVTDQETSEGG